MSVPAGIAVRLRPETILALGRARALRRLAAIAMCADGGRAQRAADEQSAYALGQVLEDLADEVAAPPAAGAAP